MKMPFFLSSVKKGYGCTSRVFVDGECLPSALLTKERTEAEIHIYPGSNQYFLEEGTPVPQDTRPLKLHMLLSTSNRFVFSLFSDDKRILTSTQDLLATRVVDWLKDENFACRTFLFIEGQSIKISMHTTSGIIREVFFQPQWHSHSQCSSRSFKDEPFELFGDSLFSNDAPERRNEQKIWISQDFDMSSAAQRSFDDREPMKMGLTGVFHWDGLRLGQIIKVTKLKFWLSNTCITGFQATYVIDGQRALGPRNRFADESKTSKLRVLELADNEGISCIHALSDTYGYVARMFIFTDRGRSFVMATAAPVVSGRTQFVLRHPKARVVGFRGSSKTGLTNFGIICELDEQIAMRMPEGLVCCVCGAHSAYFIDQHLFQTHLNFCIEHLVKNRHQLHSPTKHNLFDN